jgi:hypothetical protein
MTKRILLQDAANTLPCMIMSERLGNDDLERLAALPDGTLTVDLVAGTARHSSQPDPIGLEIVEHLSLWLKTRLGEEAFANHLAHAVLTVSIRTDRVATDRKRVIPFDWMCDSRVASRDGRTRSGTSRGLTWYDRDRRFFT